MLRKLLHILSTPTKLLFILQISLSTATIPLTTLLPAAHLLKTPLLVVCACSLGVQVLFVGWLLGDLYRGPRGLRRRWYYLPRGGKGAAAGGVEAGGEGGGGRSRSRSRSRGRSRTGGRGRVRREGLPPPVPPPPPPPVYEEGGFWSGGVVETVGVVVDREGVWEDGLVRGDASGGVGGGGGGGGGEQAREEARGGLPVGRVRRVL